MEDCVAGYSFDEGAVMFGTDAANLAHIVWRGVAVFGSGAASATYGEQRNINVSSATTITDHTYYTVVAFRLGNGAAETVKINDSGGGAASAITMSNGYV